MRRFLSILILFILLTCIGSALILWEVITTIPTTKFVKICFFFYPLGILFLASSWVKKIHNRTIRNMGTFVKRKEDEIRKAQTEAQKQVVILQKENKKAKEKSDKQIRQLENDLRTCQVNLNRYRKVAEQQDKSDH